MQNKEAPAEGQKLRETGDESTSDDATCSLCGGSGARIIGERDDKNFWNRCVPCGCRNNKKVAVESLVELANDLESWANARIEDWKTAKLLDSLKKHHEENYFCAMGQLDASQRIMDLIRNESY
jgi:hypothetical protein